MSPDTLKLAVEVVTSYVSCNTLPAAEVPGLIRSTYTALNTLGEEAAPAEEPATAKPAVPVRKSIQPAYLVCLECGEKSKMLKRHLATQHDLTPEQYRTKWGLPSDYPLVAPEYAAARSRLAKELGLGQRGRAAHDSSSPPPADT